MNDDHARHNKVCHIIFDDTSYLNQTAIAQCQWACMLPYLAAYELCGGVGKGCECYRASMNLFPHPTTTHTHQHLPEICSGPSWSASKQRTASYRDTKNEDGIGDKHGIDLVRKYRYTCG